MPASKAHQAAVAERRTKAIQMRIAKVDYQTIADKLGYSSRGAACQDITRAFERHRAEEGRNIEIMRDQEIAGLDRAQAAIWSKVVAGDLHAIDAYIRIVARRSRILGLDAIQEVKVITMDLIDAELMRLREQIAAAEAALDPHELNA